MAKIKVVQVIPTAHGEFRYLDDKGRVWAEGRSLNGYEVILTGWEQVDLPDEPKGPE